MNTRIHLAVLLGLGLVNFQAEAKEKAPELKTKEDMVSYGIGVEVARNFRKDGVEVNLDLLVRGLKDAYAGRELVVPEKELRPLMREFQGDVRRKMVANRRTAGLDNKKKAEDFLAENKKKEGIVVLPGGVQYKVVKMGNGPQPKDSDIVEVHYRGNLLNGSEFDATAPGKTANLKLSALIPGWRDAVKLMPAGSKWQIFVPPEQAYGERGVGSDIGPNELLIFDVELVGIQAAGVTPAQ